MYIYRQNEDYARRFTMKTTIARDRGPEVGENGIDDRTADTLESQVNISIFVGLIILTVFVVAVTVGHK
jgi:hypothetical protein